MDTGRCDTLCLLERLTVTLSWEGDPSGLVRKWRSLLKQTMAPFLYAFRSGHWSLNECNRCAWSSAFYEHTTSCPCCQELGAQERRDKSGHYQPQHAVLAGALDSDAELEGGPRRSGTEVASAAEDRLLMMLKQVEAKVGSALGAFSDARPVQDEARFLIPVADT